MVTEDTQIGNWLVRCVSGDGRVETCFTVTNAIHASEQRELALLEVIRVAEDDRQDDEEFAAQLTSPTNVNVRAGIEVRVDQVLVEMVPYEVCTVRSCLTTFPLYPDTIDALSNGFTAALIFVDAAGTPVSATLSLDGFARALELL